MAIGAAWHAGTGLACDAIHPHGGWPNHHSSVGWGAALCVIVACPRPQEAVYVVPVVLALGACGTGPRKLLLPGGSGPLLALNAAVR